MYLINFTAIVMCYCVIQHSSISAEGFTGGLFKPISSVLKFPGFVVNKAMNAVSTITTATGHQIKRAEAFVISTALQVVTTSLKTTMKMLGFNCFRMSRVTQKLDDFIVKNLELKNIRICGIANLKPDKKINITKESDTYRIMREVTVTEDAETYQMIRVKYRIENITVAVGAVNVKGIGGNRLLSNAPLRVDIEETFVEGLLRFNKGTILKFATIKLRVIDFKGFNIKFIVEGENSSFIMDAVEGISQELSEKVKESINERFVKIERKLSKALTGE
uniref:Protein Turandot Z n=2 Tax=Lygus hesperus TaxID=30085 RepID=A0A0A9WUU7_LYGHE